MTLDLTQFTNDIARLPIRDLIKLYEQCLPCNFDINTVIQILHQSGLEFMLIDQTWSQTNNPYPGPVMTFVHNKYSVFLVDPDHRSQTAIQNFERFDDAAKYKIELILNMIHIAAKITSLLPGSPNPEETC